MARQVAITTTDNPYNPITQYDEWERYDSVEHDYKTSSYLARICHATHELSDEMYMEEVEAAIDEIVEMNLISWVYKGISYKKVVVET